MTATLSWKLNRLRTMGLAEVGWRIRQALDTQLEEVGIGLAREPTALVTTSGGRPWVRELPTGFRTELYEDAARKIISGRWDIFTLRDCELGFPPRWNRDPKMNVIAPLEFGKRIDYRDERIVGDIKYLWEPNRHLELVTLAQAWHLTRDLQFQDAARVLLDSWFEQCPYPRGPNWTSSLELAIRLVNWSFTWHLLGGDAANVFAGVEGEQFRQRWLRSIYQHLHFIAGYLSRHSSANNHLLGELMGLFVGTMTWPFWPEHEAWRELARRELEVEVCKQIAEDGTTNEQALWYHHEIADMLMICLAIGKASGVEFSPVFARRLEAMLEFVCAVMTARGDVPMIGDGDDAVMVRWSREPRFSVFRSQLATGAVLFERGDFKAYARYFDDKTRWLLGDAGANRFASLSVAPPQTRRMFPQGGYYVLGNAFGTADEVKVVVDAGPLGYLSIAAHGHADALSFVMAIAGREILIDPGTYALHHHKRWRDYFRGTSAHNTVRVDGQDQSIAGGNFMWLFHARSTCERFESGDDFEVFEGRHDGYERFADSVDHRRTLELDNRNRQLVITDVVDCRDDHFVEQHWHLAETCEARVYGHDVEVTCDRLQVRFEHSRELAAPRLVIGREDSPLGWVSRRIGERVASPTIVCGGRIHGATILVTRISW